MVHQSGGEVVEWCQQQASLTAQQGHRIVISDKKSN
jgi:hypothetical protein